MELDGLLRLVDVHVHVDEVSGGAQFLVHASVHGEVAERGGVRGALAQRASTEEHVVGRAEEEHALTPAPASTFLYPHAAVGGI